MGLKLFTIGLVCLWGASVFGAVTEDWKGKSDPSQFDVGVLTGLGIVDATAGFSIMGTAAVRLLDRGFIPDINDQLFLEVQMGPLFVSGTTGFVFSTHLRWDFTKDDDWTFYALGGIGGTDTSSSFPATSSFRIYPRFGIGAIYSITDLIAFRAEVSHEFIGLGLQFIL